MRPAGIPDHIYCFPEEYGLEQSGNVDKIIIVYTGRNKSIIPILDKIDRNRYLSVPINRLISEIDNNR